jgi:hypothetical protein
VSSTTGLIFSYAIAIIFAVGGLAFLIFLDERRFLFGVPYLVMGLLMLGGLRASQRRRKARSARGADGDEPPAPEHNPDATS